MDGRSSEQRVQGLIEQLQAGSRDKKTADLLVCFRGAQEERVRVYKSFDDGLAQVLQSGNLHTYPSLCTDTTKAFAALSDFINAVISILAERAQDQALVQLMREVQRMEKRKLSLTAAVHLKEIRLMQILEREEKMVIEHEDVLRAGVNRLQQQIQEAAQQINGLLEDMRYEIVEELAIED